MNSTNVTAALTSSADSFSPEQFALLESVVKNLPREIVSRLEEFSSFDNGLDLAYSQLAVASGQGAWGIDNLNRGKQIFRNYMSDIRKKVCRNEPLKLYCENVRVIDALTVAALVAGGLLQSKTYNIDVASAALILSRIGIQSFCSSEWSNGPTN